MLSKHAVVSWNQLVAGLHSPPSWQRTNQLQTVMACVDLHGKVMLVLQAGSAARTIMCIAHTDQAHRRFCCYVSAEHADNAYLTVLCAHVTAIAQRVGCSLSAGYATSPDHDIARRYRDVTTYVYRPQLLPLQFLLCTLLSFTPLASLAAGIVSFDACFTRLCSVGLYQAFITIVPCSMNTAI